MSNPATPASELRAHTLPPTPKHDRIHPLVRTLAAYSWRLLVIAAAVVGVLWLAGQLLIVVIPVVVALFLTRALLRPTEWMRSHGVPAALAPALTMVVFLAVMAALVVGVGASIASEFDQLGTTVSQGIDDVEAWLVDDSPFDISRSQVADFRAEATDRLSNIVVSGGAVQTTAVLGAEVVAGILLALIVTFFLLKDHDTIVEASLTLVREERRGEFRGLGQRAWSTLGGYLRGVVLLGVVEAIIIAGAVWIVGGSLVAAVAVITMLGAFVPIVGAVVAGLVAVLATLVTAGPTAAIIVAVVAVIVQQLDNDLLAPVIYGKSLQLHPLVILLGIASGSALFGIVGAVLAVPAISVAISMVDESKHPSDDGGENEPTTAQ